MHTPFSDRPGLAERFLTPEERQRVHKIFELVQNIPRGHPGHVEPFSVWRSRC